MVDLRIGAEGRMGATSILPQHNIQKKNESGGSAEPPPSMRFKPERSRYTSRRVLPVNLRVRSACDGARSFRQLLFRNDNDNDTLREVHPTSVNGLALQA